MYWAAPGSSIRLRAPAIKQEPVAVADLRSSANKPENFPINKFNGMEINDEMRKPYDKLLLYIGNPI